MAAVVVEGANLLARAGMLVAESRVVREQDLIGRMESVLCAGDSCDIEMGMPEGWALWHAPWYGKGVFARRHGRVA